MKCILECPSWSPVLQLFIPSLGLVWLTYDVKEFSVLTFELSGCPNVPYLDKLADHGFTTNRELEQELSTQRLRKACRKGCLSSRLKEGIVWKNMLCCFCCFLIHLNFAEGSLDAWGAPTFHSNKKSTPFHLGSSGHFSSGYFRADLTAIDSTSVFWLVLFFLLFSSSYSLPVYTVWVSCNSVFLFVCLFVCLFVFKTDLVQTPVFPTCGRYLELIEWEIYLLNSFLSVFLGSMSV